MDRERKQKERELAHVIREAKSQDQSLGSSKPRNTVSFQKPKALDLTKACWLVVSDSQVYKNRNQNK